MSTLSNYEALLALSTSPALTPVMREYLVALLAEHRAMREALRSIVSNGKEFANSGIYAEANFQAAANEARDALAKVPA